MIRHTRRQVLRYGGALAGAAALSTTGRIANAATGGGRLEPAPVLQIGDVEAERAIVWGRSSGPARMHLEVALDSDFAGARRITGPGHLLASDFTGRVDVTGLLPNREIFVRVRFEDLATGNVTGPPLEARFRTAPAGSRAIRFLWGGDTAGQGWGINPDFGGMRIYDSMRRTRPDFFIHCGDTVYADGPIAAEQPAEDGKTWHNLVTPEVARVAQSLDDFRGRYRYNLLDTNLRRFSAEVPQVWLWDDHEVVNNWSPGKLLGDDDRYQEKSVPLLVARGARAFREYAPLRPWSAEEAERIYRRVGYGDLLDVFAIDMRSYRAANSWNRQPQPGSDTALLGRRQLDWLKQGLERSRALWKVIAADMPVGLEVADGTDAEGRKRFEALANGDGPVLGREFEMAELLSFLKSHSIRNTVWLTADVHYCAAHRYDPRQAVFEDFEPFWEFVAGPLNAGSFGPAALDDTFGPEVVFHRPPPAQNLSPLAGYQFFGQVDIDGQSGAMTVTLKDIDGQAVHVQEIEPAAA